MGGRGASSGISIAGNKYGSQYHTLFTEGNIKFVSASVDKPEPLLETRTKSRIYVLVSHDVMMKIIYFDKENKKRKEIELQHMHNGKKPHVHHGYYHNEKDGIKGGTGLNTQEKRMVELVNSSWYHYLHRT